MNKPESGAGGTAAGFVSFKDAAKIKSWDAWHDHEDKAVSASILAKEKRCVTMERLRALQPGAGDFIGHLRTRTSPEIADSAWSVGCECLDRDYANWDAYKELLPMLGVKHGRLLSGWAKTEQEKGVYDFAWLDPQVREMAAMGVKPWITLAYGNPVWGSDFRLGMRVRQITDNPETLAAWLRYVAAVVGRYRDVVDEWEVWNEPYGQAEEYSRLFFETARAVKAAQPEAKVYCASCGLDGVKAVLERLRREDALDLGSVFIYHPYAVNPDANYRGGEHDETDWPTKPRPLQALVRSVSPRYGIMQGEAGCPAQLEFAHALSNVEWTEYSQAKWNLRRAIGDAVRGIPSCVFTIIDYQYTFMLQSFGLIRSNALKEVVYRRPSWFAMRNVYSLFDRDVKPVGATTGKVAVACSRKEHELSCAEFDRFGKRLSLFWFSDDRPSDSMEFARLDLSARLAGLERPVWVEMVTGRVFALDDVRAVPVWDSPVMVCEQGAIDIAPAEPLPFKVDGKTFFAVPGERTRLDLRHVYPDDVVPGENGTRWAEVTFSVEAPEAGDYEFGIVNDYFGELTVNGKFVREANGLGTSWGKIAIPLEKGRNDILFRTRSGQYAGWPFGLEFPAGLMPISD